MERRQCWLLAADAAVVAASFAFPQNSPFSGQNVLANARTLAGFSCLPCNGFAWILKQFGPRSMTSCTAAQHLTPTLLPEDFNFLAATTCPYAMHHMLLSDAPSYQSRVCHGGHALL
eukprot:6192231-Pleurochrysis_carterae.AAC.1